MRYLIMVALLALGAGQAQAHAFLKTATPAVGSTLAQAPDQVVILFTEAVEPRFSTITVTDASGARVDSGDVKPGGDAEHLTVGLKTLTPGIYQVTWHATAVDTHKTEGKYSFTVGK